MAKSRKKPQGRGLGDSVEKVFKATGVDKVVKFIAGEDCGCDERKAKLNNLVKAKVQECLIESEYEFLKQVFSQSTASPLQVKECKRIEKRIFNLKTETEGCDGCLRLMMNQLKHVYDAYNKD